MTWQRMVRDFHEAMGVVVNDRPTRPDDALATLRRRLVEEEATELAAELWKDRPLASMAKEMADLIYVVLGTAVSLGIDLDPVFRAVHESNMAKASGPVREDGKRLKPEGWTPPDIAALLDEQSRPVNVKSDLTGWIHTPSTADPRIAFCDLQVRPGEGWWATTEEPTCEDCRASEAVRRG